MQAFSTDPVEDTSRLVKGEKLYCSTDFVVAASLKEVKKFFSL